MTEIHLLQGADTAKTELAVAHAHQCLQAGQASATAVQSAESMLKAMRAPNVLPLRAHTKPHTGPTPRP